MSYRVFHRTWWKRNPAWPDGREPCVGRKKRITNVATEAEARATWGLNRPREARRTERT